MNGDALDIIYGDYINEISGFLMSLGWELGKRNIKPHPGETESESEFILSVDDHIFGEVVKALRRSYKEKGLSVKTIEERYLAPRATEAEFRNSEYYSNLTEWMRQNSAFVDQLNEWVHVINNGHNALQIKTAIVKMHEALSDKPWRIPTRKEIGEMIRRAAHDEPAGSN